LQDCLVTYKVTLYAYAVMPNRYHLLVRTAYPNLGRFMQRLNTSYALYSRHKHKKPGHRLEGRYKAKLVQDDEYTGSGTRSTWRHWNGNCGTGRVERLGIGTWRIRMNTFLWTGSTKLWRGSTARRSRR
jgi:hypothetical protein